MTRYFFHIHENGELIEDPEGTELESLDMVRTEAMHVLPQIADDEISKDGDRQAFTVMVADEEGKPVYSATLTFAGLWLTKLD